MPPDNVRVFSLHRAIPARSTRGRGEGVYTVRERGGGGPARAPRCPTGWRPTLTAMVPHFVLPRVARASGGPHRAHQWFLIALSVRPGSSFAMVAHLAWSEIRVTSWFGRGGTRRRSGGRRIPREGRDAARTWRYALVPVNGVRLQDDSVLVLRECVLAHIRIQLVAPPGGQGAKISDSRVPRWLSTYQPEILGPRGPRGGSLELTSRANEGRGCQRAPRRESERSSRARVFQVILVYVHT